MVSLRAERERATMLLRRDRWRLAIAIGAVLTAIAGLLVLPGGTRSAERGVRRRSCA